MRWKFLSVLGLVVCAIAPARGELGDETVASVDAYEKCATIMAQHYATGPDVADLITKAAYRGVPAAIAGGCAKPATQRGKPNVHDVSDLSD